VIGRCGPTSQSPPASDRTNLLEFITPGGWSCGVNLTIKDTRSGAVASPLPGRREALSPDRIVEEESPMIGNRTRAILAIVCSGIWAVTAAAQTRFLQGDLVLYRVGDGSAPLSAVGTPVFLDEFTTTGVLVRSIAMPTAASGANQPLVASGTAVSEGFLNLSVNGTSLTLTGYAAAPGTASLPASAAATVPRVVGRVDGLGVVNTSTALTDFADGGNPRSAVSTNGTDIWVGGSTGSVRYTTFGSTTSTQLATAPTNMRAVNIFGGQLYVSASTGTTRLATVGVGTPTTPGQTITNLPGFPTTGSPYGYFFADLSPAVPGLDTVYVADDGIGVSKYSLVNGNWTLNGTVGNSTDQFRGLTGLSSGTSVTLFAIRTASELDSISDSSGYNGAFAGPINNVATAPSNTAWRGVSFAPVPEPVHVLLFGGATITFFGWRRTRAKSARRQR
jgi:hypothetical protein